MTSSVIIWLLIAITFYSIGEIFSKEWGMSGSYLKATLAMIFYTVGSLFWLPAIRIQNDLAKLGLCYILMSAVCTVAIGVFMYKEVLSTREWIGAIMAVGSLLLLYK